MFKIGDMVEVVEDYDSAMKGMRGRIVRSDNLWGVDFGYSFDGAHNLDIGRGGFILPRSTGQWVDPRCLKKVEQTPVEEAVNSYLRKELYDGQ